MTKRYAVIGDPVSHSLSPLMHTGWLADHGIDATYEAHLLRSVDPVAAIRALAQFAGMNVTVPYKEAAAEARDRGVIGAANVLYWTPDGSLVADNTDGEGFLASLHEAAPEWRARENRSLIIGAGGAARGIMDPLRSCAGPITFINRTRSRAEELARTGDHVRDWAELRQAFAEANLIVQTTTLGMAGTLSPDWPVDACNADTIIVDVVYRPLETPLLAAARARGLKTVDGLGMLIHQGALSFEIWHGVKPDIAKARERLTAALT